MISKLLRMYKKSHGLKQICNIAVYIAHSACTIHLLNLPDKNSVRDIIHGVRQLEEIGESWLCARKTLAILSMAARRWKTRLPGEVANVFLQNDSKFSLYRHDQESPKFENPPSLLARTTPQVPMASDFGHATNDLKNDQFSNGHSALDSSANGDPTFVADVNSFLPPSADPGQNSQQEQYAMFQDRQDLWNLEQASQVLPDQGQLSPSALLSRTESLVAESQGWWLRDHSFFENWYGSDQTALMISNSVPHDSSLMSHGLDSYGLNANGSGPGRPTY